MKSQIMTLYTDNMISRNRRVVPKDYRDKQREEMPLETFQEGCEWHSSLMQAPEGHAIKNSRAVKVAW